jgi:hypothetical protein
VTDPPEKVKSSMRAGEFRQARVHLPRGNLAGKKLTQKHWPVTLELPRFLRAGAIRQQKASHTFPESSFTCPGICHVARLFAPAGSFRSMA